MGTAYFNDGHTEPIIHYIKLSDNYIKFWTASGKYVYQSWLEEVLDGFKYRAHTFRNYSEGPDFGTIADIYEIRLEPKTILN